MKKSYALLAAILFSLISFSQDLIISEFRVRGPNGHSDEFIEIYNNSDVAHTVASPTGVGYGIVASDGVPRAVIPNGTVIPARGHWLAVNSIGYSLSSYPAGNGTTATGNATYTTDIPNNAGIALFNTNIAANFTLANRLDAAGSDDEANSLYREGAGYPAIVGFSIDHCFHRKLFNGRPQDTNNNGSDFKFEDTNGTSAGAGQSLGAPGPENLSSPVAGNGGIVVTYLDQAQPSNAAPNFVRDLVSDPPNNSTYGTIDLRFKITNNTAASVTRLRLRVTDITTFPAPAGQSDLRPRTSTDIVVPTSMGNVTVKGTVLEQPANQPNGGGFNSSMGVNSVTLASPLAPGATQYIRVLIGLQQVGSLRVKFLVEALPGGGSGFGGSGVGSSYHFGYYGNDVSAFFNGDLIKKGDLVINEFRLRGPGGVNDEFVELYNTTDHPITVATSDGSGGWALAASDGTIRFSVPNGTVIKSHGHFLAVNLLGYSLGSYPASSITTAIGDALYDINIPDNAGIALFMTSNPANFNMANRLDAVGSDAEANALYKEGVGYPALTPVPIEYSLYRDHNTPGGGPADNDDNKTDFRFEDTNGTPAGWGQRLGAPGPENTTSPIIGTTLLVKPASLAVAENAAPNMVRDGISDIPNNSTFGTMSLRYCIKNIGGAPVTRIRLRMDSISTFPSTVADLRLRTSSSIAITVPSGVVTARGTTLEQPPSQLNGGAFNSSMSVGSITLGTPLEAGDSIFVQLLFGVQQPGAFTVKFTAEGLPEGGGQTVLRSFTDPCAGITVNNPATATGTLGVAFSQSFSSSGGSGSVSYTTVSVLPAGVTLAANGTLSGTPGQTGTFPVIVKATDMNSCTGMSSMYNLVIGCPSVSVNAVNNQTVCTGVSTAPVNFSGSPASGVTYAWTNNTPSIGLGANGTGNIPSFTAMNGGSSPVTATITVTPTYTFGSGSCAGSPITFTITVTNIQLPVINTQPQDVAACVGSNVTFKTEAINALSYQWQLSTGNGFNNIAGATSATLSISNVTAAMNNYKYRVVIQGLCSQVISNAANMTVNTLPVVNVAAAPYTALHPGLLTTIYAIHDHTPGNFTWYRDNTLLRTTTASLLSNLDIDSLGTYKVVYTDNNGCSATSNSVSLVADPNYQFYVYPTPNNGQFTVRFYSQVLGVRRVLRIMDSKGAMVFRQEFTMNSPYQQMVVNLTRNSAGIYYVELHDGNGKVIARGSTMKK